MGIKAIASSWLAFAISGFLAGLAAGLSSFSRRGAIAPFMGFGAGAEGLRRLRVGGLGSLQGAVGRRNRGYGAGVLEVLRAQAFTDSRER
jgi:branched-subunit amino acid ABC-type transport system permease component